ncbi:MAG: hypothetical protein KF832_13560 [Caldilineaceae bacterium]|nr:hypothetical protein [Caldilineaceae bacterium]
MMETTKQNLSWVTEDLSRLTAMANELESYIVAGSVYRTVVIPSTNGNRKIIMSGGDILARLHRLRVHHQSLTPVQQERVEQLTGQIQSGIYALRTRFHDILRRELKARNDQLAWDVELRRAQEEKEDEKQSADPAEVQNRDHIAAIEKELNSP